MGHRGITHAIRAWGFVLGAMVGGPVFGAGTVTLDGSYGTNGALTGPNFQITAGMGRQVGSNLFHSFGAFSLVSGESATFSGPANIQNILARVTGGSPSSIDGSINTTIAGANLFFLNPAGVIFGPNAQINVPGSFVVSTADYVKMVGGGVFYTSLGGNDVLTSAPISAFGFLTPTPAPVLFEGSQLSAGTGLHVIAGDITVDNGATLFEPGGALALFSAASAGEVPFSLATAGAGFSSATNTSFGHVTVQNNSAVAIAGTSGGKVVIRGGRLTVDNSFVTAANIGSGAGPAIAVQAGQLAVQNQGVIKSAAFADGPGGAVQIHADAVTVQGVGAGLTGIVSSTGGTGRAGDVTVIVTGGLELTQGAVIGESSASSGPAGDMTIQAGSVSIDNAGISLAADDVGNAGTLTMTVTGALTMTGYGFVDATAFSSGNAGDISIHAGSLTIDGSTAAPYNNPGIFAQSQGAGNAGNLTVTVDGALVVINGGQIDSSAFLGGNGGDIAVNAGSLVLQGSTTPGFVTEIASASFVGATGNAGMVTIHVSGAMSITSGAEISGSTSSSGQGGNVGVHAGSLVIDGSAAPGAFTGIVSTANPNSTGNAGSLTVNVDGALALSGRGEIASGTFGLGDSGDVTVNAGEVSIVGASGVGNPTGIFAQTAGSGNAGEVNLNVSGVLGIFGFGEIDTSTFASGRAGDVNVRAQTLGINGAGAPANLSGILSSATFGSSGPAGSVNVGVAGTLSLASGAVISSASGGSGPGGGVVVAGNDVALGGASTISASAVAADAGTVTVNATDTASLTNGSSIDTSAGANGGNITMQVGNVVYLFKSRITAQAHDNGGNIFIDPHFVVLNQSQITANAALGQGGNITIITDDFLNNDSAITATGSTNGTIIISSPNVDLSGSLVGLEGSLVTDESRLRETCARSVNHEFSTLIMVGRGGIETAPDELQPDAGASVETTNP